MTYLKSHISNRPADNYMFKINNRSTRRKGETCSKLTIKTPGQQLFNESWSVNKYNIRNIFVEKSYTKCGAETTTRLF